MNPKAMMSAYKSQDLQSSIDVASSHQLIAMLLKGAMDKLAHAKHHLRQSNYVAKGECAGKAISIIEYLRACLELGGDPSFAERLGNLYSYMETRILRLMLEMMSRVLLRSMIYFVKSKRAGPRFLRSIVANERRLQYCSVPCYGSPREAAAH